MKPAKNMIVNNALKTALVLAIFQATVSALELIFFLCFNAIFCALSWMARTR